MLSPSSAAPPTSPRPLPADLRLPARTRLLQTDDLSVASPLIERVHARFSWRARDPHGPPAGLVQVHTAACGPLRLSMLAYGRALEIRPEHLGDGLLMTTVLQGRLRQDDASGGSRCGQAGDTLLASDADRPVYGYDAAAVVLKLRLDPARIDALCARWLGRRVAAPVRFAAAGLDAAGSAGWLNLVGHLVEALHASEAPPELLGRGLEEMLILHLLRHAAHDQREAMQRAQAPCTPREYRRACRYIEDHLPEAMTLADIAEAAGCSIRSLTRAFRSAGGSTPMRHVQVLRLQRVQAALRDGSHPAATIADVATRWGFGHLGEFNRQYRLRFGETPSQTRGRPAGG